MSSEQTRQNRRRVSNLPQHRKRFDGRCNQEETLAEAAMALLALACLRWRASCLARCKRRPRNASWPRGWRKRSPARCPPVHMEGSAAFCCFPRPWPLFTSEMRRPWLEVATRGSRGFVPALRGQVARSRRRCQRDAAPPAAPVCRSPRNPPTAPPALRDLPGWLRVGRLQVERAALGAPVLGEALRCCWRAYHPKRTRRSN